MHYILENTPSVRQVEHQMETKHALSLHAVIAIAVVGGVLLLFTVVFIIWLTRIHKEEGDDEEYPMRNVNRIVNSLKRGSLKRQEKPPKYYNSSSDSEDDIENLMLRKMNNEVPRNQPWYKSRKL